MPVAPPTTEHALAVVAKGFDTTHRVLPPCVGRTDQGAIPGSCASLARKRNEYLAPVQI